MAVHLQITLKDIGAHETQRAELEQKIQDKVDKLAQFCDQIMVCKVVIDQIQKHKHQGKLYTVGITLTVPNAELVVNHDKSENLQIALREAFLKMRRQLEGYNQRLHGGVKTHAETLQGEVVRLFEEDQFGFIRSVEGEEYYFSASSVLHPEFKRLKIGTRVQFIEFLGNEGLQAHRVSGLEERS